MLNKEYEPALINSINEIYFRHYRETKFYPVNSRSTLQDIVNLSNIATELGNEELYNLIKDLYCVKYVDLPIYDANSELLQSIMKKLRSYSTRFRDIRLPLEVVDILKTSYNSYLVGGSVRDTLLGKTPKDFDFVTDLDYDVMSKLFANRGFVVKEAGKQFLVMIVSKDGQDYEIACFRSDSNYSDGRRPESVEIGDIYSDAHRRDFTVNALYYSLSSESLVDPTGKGISDIENKTLRFVGKPEDRIRQDYLRVFRFYRFLHKGFFPDTKSLKAVRTLFDEAIRNTASERIKNEIETIVLK